MSGSPALRRSAVHACLERLAPTWEERDGALVAIDFGDRVAEAARARSAGLADRGVLPRLALKGPDAPAWARAQGIEVPDAIYGWTRSAGGALTVRLGTGELLLEGAHVAAVEAALAHDAPQAACWPVRREDAAFLLTGARAAEVLAQACSYDFRGAAGRFVMTRVALVSCSILVEMVGATAAEGVEDADPVPVYHLWTAASYGAYLWEELLAIVRECGGGAVGDAAAAALLAGR